MAKFYCPTKLSENISETPEGYLLCVGVPIARTGVMEYGEGETPLEVGEDGRVYVMRDAAEVFRPATIASFEGKSVTIRHPEQFVGPENWKELTKGTVHNVRRGKEKDDDGEESLLADVLITEAFAISLVKNGLREVSCGYEAEYEQTGEGKGKQTNIVGNHLALVEEGRAGSSYAIHDHKGRIAMGKSIGDKLKKLLGKTIDEAVAEGEKAAKKPAAKVKAKDEAVVEKVSGKEETNRVMDEDKAYDELKKMYDDMGEKLAAMKPKAQDEEEKEESEDEEEEKEEKEESKDEEEKEESEDEEEEKEEKEESKDEGEDTEILERVKALEAAVSKLLESKDAEEGEEESEDDDLEGEEGEESQKKTGDEKAKKTGLEKTKSVDTKPITFESFDSSKEEMTPEKMNELNAAHWARK